MESVLLASDQPMTCPKCGARTEFADATHEKCLGCGELIAVNGDPARMWTEATRAAKAAAKAENDRLPPENARGLDCGFAWIIIRPSRGAFVQWCKRNGIGETRQYGGGGFEIWYSKLHDIPTQSISVHQAAARAAADVLKRYGLGAYVGSRLD